MPAAVTGDHERERIRRRVAQIRAAGARNEEEGEETQEDRSRRQRVEALLIVGFCWVEKGENGLYICVRDTGS